MSETEISPALPTYKDRYAGLVAFGIVQIVLGGFTALMIPLLLFSQHVMAQQQPGSVYGPSLALVMAMYGTLALVLVCVGIGSIKARRWARALTLVGAWSLLIMGVFMFAGEAFMLPRLFAAAAPSGNAMPQAAMVAVMVTTLLVMGVVFVALPAVFAWFYGSRHVKATCEARTPKTSWTDGCPLPLLALCLWMALGTVSFFIMALAGMAVLPVFGQLIAGPVATIVSLLLGAAWAWAAWAIYRRRLAAWWFIVGMMTVFGVSCVITFLRVDPLEIYRVMHYPEPQIEQIRRFGMMTGPMMAWSTAGGGVLWLGFLLWVRRYFKPVLPPPTPTAPLADAPLVQ
jgi:hypothetical protein